MDQTKEKIYEFGNFRLDFSKRRLERAGKALALNAKTFDLLAFLAANNGRVITKDEILETVWENQFVEEANLTVQISALRKVLGEKKDAPAFLHTIPGKGYQFIAEASQHDEEIVIQKHEIKRLVVDEEIEDTSGGTETKQLAAPDFPSRRAVIFVFACFVLLLAGFAAYKYFHYGQQSSVKSIAVLPFKPLVAENRNESLEMGMADALITKLSNLGEINVRPISAVRRYAGIEQDAIAAGREQLVDAVLDGQIQKSEDKIRVTVRLVRVTDGTLVWTSQFDEKMSGIFEVQDSISARVADALTLKLTGEQKNRLAKRHTANSEAYQLYLLGRFHFAKRTRESIAKSIDYFNQAIEKDPNYALAYVGLGAAFAISGWYEYLSPDESYPKAKEAIGKALQLDDSIAEAYAVSGNVKRSYDWDLKGAENDYRRALELDPNNPTTHHWLGLTLAMSERYDESIHALRRAQQLDPLSVIINNALGGVLSFARRFDEAIAQYEKVLELEPNFPYAHMELGTCYYYKNMNDRAVEHWLKGVGLMETSPADIETLRNAYRQSGMKAFWREMAHQNRRSKEYVSSFNTALFYAAAGDKEQALDWLEKAYRERSSGMTALNVELFFDDLRSEPRFVELARRIGLSR